MLDNLFLLLSLFHLLVVGRTPAEAGVGGNCRLVSFIFLFRSDCSCIALRDWGIGGKVAYYSVRL